MSSEEDGRTFAERTRAENGLGTAPIADMGELLEELAGADVVALVLPDGHDGLTRRNPRTGDIVVAVNVSHSPERQRFTLAHELGHIVAKDFHESLEHVHVQGEAESRAHAFARHFLVPLPAVARHAERASGLELISNIVRVFGVSPKVALIQLRRLGIDLSDEAHDHSAAWFATRFGWDSERAGQVERAGRVRPPRGIVAAATAAYEAGVMDKATLARIRKVQIPQLDQVLEDAGIEQGEPTRPRTEFNVGDEDW